MWQSEDRGRELLSSALVGCTRWGAGIGGKLGFRGGIQTVQWGDKGHSQRECQIDTPPVADLLAPDPSFNKFHK